MEFLIIFVACNKVHDFYMGDQIREHNAVFILLILKKKKHYQAFPWRSLILCSIIFPGFPRLE